MLTLVPVNLTRKNKELNYYYYYYYYCVKIVPLLDVHQLLMLFAGTVTYYEPGTFSSIVFYDKL
jgi:hypothetical protein